MKKILVIGLGSMGKRRIRCLRALGISDITGFDLREDRRSEASLRYGIKTINIYNRDDLHGTDAIIISTPPDRHLEYALDAIASGIPCFIEASVIAGDVSLMIESLQKNRSFVAPSCTLKFHPMVRKISDLVNSGSYGPVSNFTYHCGQFLPDWHPWENISDYYVSKRETGGAREIVPFELTWITGIFGFPDSVKGYFAKTAGLAADIENTYSFTMKFAHYTGNVTVDVVSRFATRSLILNFEKGQLRWNWEENEIRMFEQAEERWITLSGGAGNAEEGYNKNITEEMYIDEIRSFLDGISDPELFPNDPENDRRVLKLLEQIENSDGGFYR